jgi:hypothetical protein
VERGDVDLPAASGAAVGEGDAPGRHGDRVRRGVRSHDGGDTERWFGELTTKKLQRRTHRSVQALNVDIRDWIKTWNDNPRPCVWTKTADQILDSIARYCARINDSGHQARGARFADGQPHSGA